MKEPRVEKVVEELKETITKLNRLNSILVKTGTTFHLHRSTKESDFTITDIEQRVSYD